MIGLRCGVYLGKDRPVVVDMDLVRYLEMLTGRLWHFEPCDTRLYVKYFDKCNIFAIHVKVFGIQTCATGFKMSINPCLDPFVCVLDFTSLFSQNPKGSPLENIKNCQNSLSQVKNFDISKAWPPIGIVFLSLKLDRPKFPF